MRSASRQGGRHPTSPSSWPARASISFSTLRRRRAAIVTCGGLCPGLNNVIRTLFFELHENYGVREVLGIRYGYAGLNPAVAQPPLVLNHDFVEDIHHHGGTVLGTSRGQQPATAVCRFSPRRQGINILFCVGGDGTQRGATISSQKSPAGNCRSPSSAFPKRSTTISSFAPAPSAFHRRRGGGHGDRSRPHGSQRRLQWRRPREADGPRGRLYRRRRDYRQRAR